MFGGSAGWSSVWPTINRVWVSASTVTCRWISSWLKVGSWWTTKSIRSSPARRQGDRVLDQVREIACASISDAQVPPYGVQPHGSRSCHAEPTSPPLRSPHSTRAIGSRWSSVGASRIDAPSTAIPVSDATHGTQGQRRQLRQVVGQLGDPVQQVLHRRDLHPRRALPAEQQRGRPQVRGPCRPRPRWSAAVPGSTTSPSSSLASPSRPSDRIGPKAASSRLVGRPAPPPGGPSSGRPAPPRRWPAPRPKPEARRPRRRGPARRRPSPGVVEVAVDARLVRAAPAARARWPSAPRSSPAARRRGDGLLQRAHLGLGDQLDAVRPEQLRRLVLGEGAARRVLRPGSG